MLVRVKRDDLSSGDGTAEAIRPSLLQHGIAIPRGLVTITRCVTEFLLTNFSNECREIAEGTTLAVFEDIPDTTDCFVLYTDPTPKATSKLSLDVNPRVPQTKREKLLELLHSCTDCFSSTSRVRQTPLRKHRIITDESECPVYQHPYRVSPKERDAIRRQVQEMLADDVNKLSKSPWASPVVLMRKKGGTLRFCVDYRKINQVSKKDVYSLPRRDDSLDHRRHAHYFSFMKLKSGYWQIEDDERDREKTAFVTPDGLNEFKVLPFGLSSAPATFQRMMDTVLSGLKWQTSLVYLDDVVVFSNTF